MCLSWVLFALFCLFVFLIYSIIDQNFFLCSVCCVKFSPWSSKGSVPLSQTLLFFVYNKLAVFPVLEMKLEKKNNKKLQKSQPQGFSLKMQVNPPQLSEAFL